MTQKAKGLLEVHAAVFLFGISGLFPKLIHLPTAIIVLGRSFIGAITLYLLSIISGKSLKLNSNKHLLILGLLGAVYALNAFAFYQAIKLSTVAAYSAEVGHPFRGCRPPLGAERRWALDFKN